MSVSKFHPLKQFIYLLRNRSRILILGPLEIDPKLLKTTLKLLRPDCILLIDGGLRHRTSLTKTQRSSSFSVGDGDSQVVFPPPLTQSCDSLDILLPVQKDYSDLAFALKALVRSNNTITGLHLLGFSSLFNEKRIDHLMFNLSEIKKITARLNIPVKLDEQFIFFPPGNHSFIFQGLFSLMTFSNTSLKITGKCEYQLKEWTNIPALSSRGLSNIGSGRIKIECKKTIMLYFAGNNIK